MSTDTLTAFDAAVLIIIGLSTLFAFGRGFATVALSFGAWAGALLATVFGFELASPYGRELISRPSLPTSSPSRYFSLSRSLSSSRLPNLLAAW
nr:hypothetical protein [Kordiimonas gwangyangensis]